MNTIIVRMSIGEITEGARPQSCRMSLIRSGCGFLCSSDSGYCCRSGDPSADRRIPSFSQARARSDGFADLLASDVVQEIEPLPGRQAVEDLDLEALELAVR